jgi:MoxR-like ATPase
MADWKIFRGSGAPHDSLKHIPPAPPWRFARGTGKLEPPSGPELLAERKRAEPFLPTHNMILAVNAALYLRRPLLLAGKPGTGKSTLISKVAYELMLGRVIRWPINSRSTVRAGVYDYDAVGRLQSGDERRPVAEYVKLGPLGTALMADDWPRALLIDEIDKSDLDFANDLLDVIEEGYYEIPELSRMRSDEPFEITNSLGRKERMPSDGHLTCGQFPFVVMTSNAEREFPPAFLRRCVRLNVEPPDVSQLTQIVQSHLKEHAGVLNSNSVQKLIVEFDRRRKDNQDIATDQLLNALYLTVAIRDAHGRSFEPGEEDALRDELLRKLTGPAA